MLHLMKQYFKISLIFFHPSLVFFMNNQGNGVIFSEVQLKKHSGGRYT
jgi:hypothetical protein